MDLAIANKYGYGRKIKSEYRHEKFSYYLSDLDLELLIKNTIEGLKAIKIGRHYKDEDLDKYCRMQQTSKENYFRLNFYWPKDNYLEKPPGIFDLNDSKNDFQWSVKFEAVEKIVENILETQHETTFKSKLNEILGFAKKRSSAGTQLSGILTIMVNIGRVHLTCNCVDGSVVNGRRQGFLFSFIFSAPLGFWLFTEPTSNLFEKVNEDKPGVITVCLELNDGSIVDFNDETLTFTAMFWKIWNFFVYPKWQLRTDWKVFPIVRKVDITHQRLTIHQLYPFTRKLEKRLYYSKVIAV